MNRLQFLTILILSALISNTTCKLSQTEVNQLFTNVHRDRMLQKAFDMAPSAHSHLMPGFPDNEPEPVSSVQRGGAQATHSFNGMIQSGFNQPQAAPIHSFVTNQHNFQQQSQPIMSNQRGFQQQPQLIMPNQRGFQQPQPVMPTQRGFEQHQAQPAQSFNGMNQNSFMTSQRGINQPQSVMPTQRGFEQPQPIMPTQRGFEQPQPTMPSQRGFEQPQAQPAQPAQLFNGMNQDSFMTSQRGLNQPQPVMPAQRGFEQPQPVMPTQRGFEQHQAQPAQPFNGMNQDSFMTSQRGFNQPQPVMPAQRGFEQPQSSQLLNSVNQGADSFLTNQRGFNQPQPTMPSQRGFEQTAQPSSNGMTQDLFMTNQRGINQPQPAMPAKRGFEQIQAQSSSGIIQNSVTPNQLGVSQSQPDLRFTGISHPVKPVNVNSRGEEIPHIIIGPSQSDAQASTSDSQDFSLFNVRTDVQPILKDNNMMNKINKVSPKAAAIDNAAVTGIIVSQTLIDQKLNPNDPNAMAQLSQVKAPSVFCPFPKNTTCSPNFPYRSFDGSCNNLKNQWWGQTETPYKRWLKPDYADDMDEPRRSVDGGELPNPRDIACSLHADVYDPEPFVTHMFMQWGQFINHDITSLSVSREDDVDSVCNKCEKNDRCHPIMITDRMSCNCVSTMKHPCIEFTRSSASFPDTSCSLGRREQLNMQTDFLDASGVYGKSINENAGLRDLKGGKGLLIMQDGFLQTNKAERPADCLAFTEKTRCFVAGDDRVNVHPGLASVHTIFGREHNRIATILSSLNPKWTDETIFQETRRIVIATLQHITYNEYIPALLSPQTIARFGLIPGRGTDQTLYKYDENIDPRAANEWAAAAGRFGHSAIRTEFSRLNNKYEPNGHTPYMLRNNYFRSTILYDQCQGGLESIVRGFVKDPLMKIDRWFTSEITQHLFETKDKLGNPFHFDLVSLNIARGRDHGVPSYKQFRTFCGLPAVSTWTDMEKFIFSDVVQKLKELYRFVDDVDLFTASISEFKEDSSIVGPTLNCLLGLQFRDTKFGDRFWYESNAFPASFTPEQLGEIRKVTLSKLLCNNLADTPHIQPMGFMSSSFTNNNITDCNRLPDIDWRFWKV